MTPIKPDTDLELRMYCSPCFSCSKGDTRYSTGVHRGSRTCEELPRTAEITERVYAEAPGQSEPGENHRGDRRTDDAGEIESAGVERDRVDEILAIDELDDHRLARGNLECGDDAAHRRQNEKPGDVDAPAPGEPPQGHRFSQQQRLTDDHDPELAVAIGENPAIQGQQQHRKASRRADDAYHERAVGDLECEPAHSHRLHPCSDQRNGLAAPEKPEVAVDEKRPEWVDRLSEGARRRGMGHSAEKVIHPVASRLYVRDMRFHTYSKFSPEAADAVDLQALLDKLADFLLQSGFAGGQSFNPYFDDFDSEPDRSLEALRQAILDALIESGQFTPDLLEALRGDGNKESQQKLSELLDQLVQKLAAEGYLNLQAPPQMPAGHQPVTGKGSLAQAASKSVQFNLTDKGIDFLGYKSLRHILSSLGKSSFGSHDTPHLATGIEADGYSKAYEFGDVLNMDVNETLKNSLMRTGSLEVPMDLDYEDLMVRQAEYRSSCATVLMLDTSHSMILYGEDRFTPAKKVALALTHLIRTQFPGDTLQVVLFHDSAEEIPLSTLPQAQVGPYHTNTAEGLKLARRLLMAQKKDMRQIVMITDGKPSAMTMPNGQIYKNSMGLDSTVIATTLREVANCRRAGILINTFMLARDRALVEFVKRVSEISKGKAYFTNTMTLGAVYPYGLSQEKTQKISTATYDYRLGALGGAAGSFGRDHHFQNNNECESPESSLL